MFKTTNKCMKLLVILPSNFLWWWMPSGTHCIRTDVRQYGCAYGSVATMSNWNSSGINDKSVSDRRPHRPSPVMWMWASNGWAPFWLVASTMMTNGTVASAPNAMRFSLQDAAVAYDKHLSMMTIFRYRVNRTLQFSASAHKYRAATARRKRNRTVGGKEREKIVWFNIDFFLRASCFVLCLCVLSCSTLRNIRLICKHSICMQVWSTKTKCLYRHRHP